MKKIITTLLFAYAIGTATIAQTKQATNSKVFNAIITDVICGDNNCSIGISTNPDESLKLTFEMDGKTLKLNDFGKLIIGTRTNGDLFLNPRFRNVTVKITCFINHVSGKDENGEFSYDETTVEKIEPIKEKDNFKTATCKAYSITGELMYIVENNAIYPISKGQKGTAIAIQGTDELCFFNPCSKVKVDANGCVSIYKLSEKTGNLKIVGDKIYAVKKGEGCEPELKKEYLEFTGNKTQIALIGVLYRLGMGH